MSQRRLVILDRDGVINEDSPSYVRSPAQWQAIAGSLEAIARLTRAGTRIAVATNQSGLARGLFTRATLRAIHARMHAEVRALGGRIDRVEFCPHGPDDGCACRKPEPGLLLAIARSDGHSLTGVPFVGDSPRDLAAARAAGCTPVLVLTGWGWETESALTDRERSETAVFADLAAFADAYLAEQDLLTS